MKLIKINISKRREIKDWIDLFQNDNEIYSENSDDYWCEFEYDRDNKVIYCESAYGIET